MQSRQIRMMGTIIHLMVEHQNANLVLDELVERLKEYEMRFSANDARSELMEVNKQAGVMPVKVHPSLYELIKIGKFHSTASNSSLNIAIGPLVQAWRIGFNDAKVPRDTEIHSLLSKTDANNIILDDENETVFLKKTGMFIDLGALAKGFIADLLIREMESMGVRAGMVNLGGNVMTYGHSPNQKDGYWRIGIQHPFLSRGNNIAIVRALNQSVVTSGIYERKLTVNKQTYHHILDPQTGYPIQTEIAALTIVSKKSVDGEIWTGRLFGKSPAEILDTLDGIEDVAGIVVTMDGELYYSESLKPYIIKT